MRGVPRCRRGDQEISSPTHSIMGTSIAAMDFVKHVRDSADIVRIVGDYVRLKKVGTRYSGLCPFHTEKTPSFSVNPDFSYFICFGCGEKGSVFDFVMK